MQSADGSFNLSSDMLETLSGYFGKIILQVLERASGELKFKIGSMLQTVLQTLLATAWLKLEYPADENKRDIPVSKAQKWIGEYIEDKRSVELLYRLCKYGYELRRAGSNLRGRSG